MIALWATFPVHFYVFIETGGSVGDVWNFKNQLLKFTGILGFSVIYSTVVLVTFLVMSLFIIFANSSRRWLQKLNW